MGTLWGWACVTLIRMGYQCISGVKGSYIVVKHRSFAINILTLYISTRRLELAGKVTGRKDGHCVNFTIAHMLLGLCRPL